MTRKSNHIFFHVDPDICTPDVNIKVSMEILVDLIYCMTSMKGTPSTKAPLY